MKKAIIGIIVILVLGAAAFYVFTGTPRYSLYKLKKAIENHDSITFNKYVDVERVVDGIVAEATSEVDNSEENEFLAGFAQAMMGSLRTGIKDALNKSVEDVSSGEAQEFTELKIKEIKKEGKSAEVTLAKDDGEPFRLSMIQTPERYWRVVRVSADDFKKVNPDALKGQEGSNESTSEEGKKSEASVKFGDKVAIGEGWFITVQKPEVFVAPAGSFFEPEAGKKIVAVSIEYANDTNEGDTVSTENLTLKDKENQVYEQSIWGGKEPDIKTGTTVPAHDKVRGYVNFVVPEGAEIVKAVYSNSASTVTIE